MLKRTLSTVARGTAYEEQCRLFVQEQLAMTLTRVGRANDNGIDLRGFWRPGSTSYNVIAQCKRYSKKVPPSDIRELEGTTSTYIHRDDVAATASLTVLALLFSNAGFTDKSILRAASSRTPMMLVTLKALEEDERHKRVDRIDLACKGVLPNEAFRKATSDKLASHWSHLMDRDGTPRYVQFHYENRSLAS